MSLSTRKQFNASCFRQGESSLKVAVSMHHVFVNKKVVEKVSMHYVFVKKRKLRYQCIMSVIKRAFKSCGVIASCLSTKKLFKRCQCIMFLSARKQFKSGGVIASCLCQQLSFFKRCQCIMFLSARMLWCHFIMCLSKRTEAV